MYLPVSPQLIYQSLFRRFGNSYLLSSPTSPTQRPVSRTKAPQQNDLEAVCEKGDNSKCDDNTKRSLLDEVASAEDGGPEEEEGADKENPEMENKSPCPKEGADLPSPLGERSVNTLVDKENLDSTSGQLPSNNSALVTKLLEGSYTVTEKFLIKKLLAENMELAKANKVR